ncbi:hypothetical protein ACLMJK_008422 [Lecanora helva]
MKTLYTPSEVLLVGSLQADSTEDAFRKVSRLGLRLHSAPDGETGKRSNYIGWQLNVFPQETIRLYLGGTESSDPDLQQFSIQSINPTQYDDAAIESYAMYTTLRTQQVFPPQVRFQVSFPTPFNCVQGHVRPEFQAALEPLYTARFIESLKRIVRIIPSADLAIQFDLCFDVIALEYDKGRLINDQRGPDFFKPHFSPIKQGLLERLNQVCAELPREVKLGFHLCYGDLRHKHFVESEDLALLVDLANSIVNTLSSKHSVDWVHMPVPQNRYDTTYFKPLRNLRLPKGRLYLGLVHAHDEEGTKARIQTAHEVFGHPFGIATEYGMGRTPKDDVASILHILDSVTAPGSMAARLA